MLPLLRRPPLLLQLRLFILLLPLLLLPPLLPVRKSSALMLTPVLVLATARMEGAMQGSWGHRWKCSED